MITKRVFFICIFIGLFLIGCGSSAGQAAATATIPPTPSQTPVPTATPTPTPEPEPEIGSVLLSEVDGMSMVFVPGGAFQMGSTDEEIDLALEECQAFWEGCTRVWFEDEFPAHEVNLDPYWIDQTEVTIEMYSRCVAAGECLEPAADGYYYYSGYFTDPQFQDYPVTYINWEDAQAYCAWAGRRLPTEAEWELAARGPEGNVYPWGDGPVNNGLLNFRDINFSGSYLYHTVDDGYSRMAPVGSYPAGASYYGALDLAGNVREWVDDWYQVYPGGDPSASEDFGQTERVFRGGDYVSLFSEVRSAYRYSADPEQTFWPNLGFRCAMTHSEEVSDLYFQQQAADPQPTLAPIFTVTPGGAEEAAPAPETACQFIYIQAYPGHLGFFSEEELPVFGYQASGFIPEEFVSVTLTGVTQAGGLSYSMDVADFVYANGKGMVDGILVWSESGILGASIPSELTISVEGDNCSLSEEVNWPYEP